MSCVPLAFHCYGMNQVHLQCFPIPAPEPAISPRSPGSFDMRMVLRNQHLGARCAQCCGVLLLLRAPLMMNRERGYLCVYNPCTLTSLFFLPPLKIHMSSHGYQTLHTYLCFCTCYLCIYSLAPQGSFLPSPLLFFAASFFWQRKSWLPLSAIYL